MRPRPPKIMTGFRGAYSKEFLEQLAKDLGIEWTYIQAITIPKDQVPVRPMDPPSGELHYAEIT